MQDKDDQEMNSGVKIACAVLLVAIVTAAGVGLLVQHRKLDELRRAHASLEASKQILVADHAELVSANQKMEDTLRELRQLGLACAAERTAVEKERASWKAERARFEKERASWKAERTKFERERTAWKAERASVENERTALKAEAAAARAAQVRAEKESSALKASEKKLKASVKKLQQERDGLERELNEAMQRALGTDAPDRASVVIPVTPAPPPDKLTPEGRAVQEKEELKDLIGL